MYVLSFEGKKKRCHSSNMKRWKNNLYSYIVSYNLTILYYLNSAIHNMYDYQIYTNIDTLIYT